jgi:uncharacterized protein YqfB (UPF0267 family)
MYTEKVAVLIKNNIVKSVISIGVPNSIEDKDDYALEMAKKTIGVQDVLISNDTSIEEGDGYKNGSFYKRDKKEFCLAFISKELGVKLFTLEEYSDQKTLKEVLSNLYPDINEFFIIPNEEFDYIKSLPKEALDFSSPDIKIKG